MKKRTIGRQRKKRVTILISVALFIAATVTVVFWVAPTSVFFQDKPEQVTVTVAWNPHSMADDIIRVMADGMDTQVMIQNIPGASGGNGLNAVFNAPHDGTSLLSTSLSAFVTGEPMGFAKSSYRDWAVWLCAFAPALVVVAAQSPYQTMEDLLTALRQNPGRLRCANPGFGTVSFASAELLRTQLQLEFEHDSHAGNIPAINALVDGKADFAVLLSIEAVDRLRSGELRVLETDLQLGEYYGLFTPANVPGSRLRGLDALIKSATESETFAAFLYDRGLESVTPDRKNNNETVNRIAALLCRTLYDTGYLPTSG